MIYTTKLFALYKLTTILIKYKIYNCVQKCIYPTPLQNKIITIFLQECIDEDKLIILRIVQSYETRTKKNITFT